MSSRRRANNRGRNRASKTNLDDLDGALSGMIRPPQDVKLLVDPNSTAEERRFTMHSSNTTTDNTIFANSSHSKNADHMDVSGQTTDFEKHQVNYGATKYIKP